MGDGVSADPALMHALGAPAAGVAAGRKSGKMLGGGVPSGMLPCGVAGGGALKRGPLLVPVGVDATASSAKV